jgi:hypothetical protein
MGGYFTLIITVCFKRLADKTKRTNTIQKYHIQLSPKLAIMLQRFVINKVANCRVVIVITSLVEEEDEGNCT